MLALLESFADPHEPKDNGQPYVLRAVIMAGKDEEGMKRVKALLDAGGDPDRGDGDAFTPLIAATLMNNVAMMDVLLDAGADVNARTPEGRTALHAAATMDHADAARLLIERGADVNHRAKDGRTPRELAETLQSRNVAALLSDPVRRERNPRPTRSLSGRPGGSFLMSPCPGHSAS